MDITLILGRDNHINTSRPTGRVLGNIHILCLIPPSPKEGKWNVDYVALILCRAFFLMRKNSFLSEQSIDYSEICVGLISDWSQFAESDVCLIHYELKLSTKRSQIVYSFPFFWVHLMSWALNVFIIMTDEPVLWLGKPFRSCLQADIISQHIVWSMIKFIYYISPVMLQFMITPGFIRPGLSIKVF